MKVYISAFKTSVASLIQYRVAALSGCATQLFFGFVKIMIFQAYYAFNTEVQPMTFEQMVSYIWLSQALYALIPTSVDNSFADLIRSGNIVYELTRPVDIFTFWLSKHIAQRVVPTLLRCIPLIIVTTIIFPILGQAKFALQPPETISALIFFICSLGLAVMIATALCLLLSMALFWTISATGVSTLLPVIIYTFSGVLLPISFFPDSWRRIIHYLPFRGIMDIPFQIYVGSVQGRDIIGELCLQGLWTIM